MHQSHQELPLTTLWNQLIDNASSQAISGHTLPVIDPSSGEVYATIPRSGVADVDIAVKAARTAFGRNGDGPWGRLTPVERGRLLTKLSDAVLEHADELAEIESRDAGKLMRQACSDVTALARYCEFYAGATDKLHGETIPYLAGYTVLTLREPYGVTGQIIPWNYPLQVFGRSVMPALATGNVCIVKPSEDACLSILRVAELAREVGFPDGAINVITGYGHEVGAAIASHPDIDHISFTGSPIVGRLVAQAAAKHHTPVLLELGGKSPQIVFADADFDEVLPTITNALIQNCGQTCTAGSRLLVERSKYEWLLEQLALRFEMLQVGPASADLDLGPLINRKQLERVRAFADEVKSDGLTIVAQGRIVSDAPPDGFYHPPILVRDVPRDHRLAQEEVFGPILAAMPFSNEAEAIELANSTNYGLGAAVWTSDGARQLRMAKKIESGQVFVNTYGAGGGVELPLGGVKHSGHGREKGFEALYSCTRVKTVVLKHG